MEHNIPESYYGSKFIFTIILNLLWFISLVLDFKIDFVIIVSIGIILSLLLSFLDLKGNFVKNKLLYIFYLIAAIMNLIGLKYIFILISGQEINVPRIAFVMLLGLSLIPGYFIIKIFQNFINNKLHKEYWDKFENK